MGTSLEAIGVAGVLFGPVQQRVFALLFAQPSRQFQSAELIRLAASGTGAVHRLLTSMERAGLVVGTKIGNQKHYRANTDSPVFAELHGLILKTVGAVGPLREALAPFGDEIKVAFVYGSVARGTDNAASDIDLLIVSKTLSYADAYERLQGAERVLARPINPTIMTPAEWRSKRAVKSAFASRIVHDTKLYVIGSADDIS